MSFIYTIEVEDSSEPFLNQLSGEIVLCFPKVTKLLVTPPLGTEPLKEIKLNRNKGK